MRGDDFILDALGRIGVEGQRESEPCRDRAAGKADADVEPSGPRQPRRRSARGPRPQRPGDVPAQCRRCRVVGGTRADDFAQLAVPQHALLVCGSEPVAQGASFRSDFVAHLLAARAQPRVRFTQHDGTYGKPREPGRYRLRSANPRDRTTSMHAGLDRAEPPSACASNCSGLSMLRHGARSCSRCRAPHRIRASAHAAVSQPTDRGAPTVPFAASARFRK